MNQEIKRPKIYRLIIELQEEPNPGNSNHFAALIANDYRIIKHIEKVDDN